PQAPEEGDEDDDPRDPVEGEAAVSEDRSEGGDDADPPEDGHDEGEEAEDDGDGEGDGPSGPGLIGRELAYGLCAPFERPSRASGGFRLHRCSFAVLRPVSHARVTPGSWRGIRRPGPAASRCRRSPVCRSGGTLEVRAPASVAGRDATSGGEGSASCRSPAPAGRPGTSCPSPGSGLQVDWL